MRFNPKVWHIMVFLLALVVGLCAYLEWSTRSDCETICETRHTRMRETTHYGCLCEDGTVIPAPPVTYRINTYNP